VLSKTHGCCRKSMGVVGSPWVLSKVHGCCRKRPRMKQTVAYSYLGKHEIHKLSRLPVQTFYLKISLTDCLFTWTSDIETSQKLNSKILLSSTVWAKKHF
jgi:hypothetical protein